MREECKYSGWRERVCLHTSVGDRGVKTFSGSIFTPTTTTTTALPFLHPLPSPPAPPSPTAATLCRSALQDMLPDIYTLVLSVWSPSTITTTQATITAPPTTPHSLDTPYYLPPSNTTSRFGFFRFLCCHHHLCQSHHPPGSGVSNQFLLPRDIGKPCLYNYMWSIKVCNLAHDISTHYDNCIIVRSQNLWIASVSLVLKSHLME